MAQVASVIVHLMTLITRRPPSRDQHLKLIITAYLYRFSHTVTKPTKCAPSKDSDHPGYPPSPIRVFVARMTKALYMRTANILISKADLSLIVKHIHIIGYLMSSLSQTFLSVNLIICLCGCYFIFGLILWQGARTTLQASLPR